MVPHAFPYRAQSAASVSATQPQTFGVWAPQACSVVQVPQLDAERGVPQLSVELKVPQFFPRRAQNWVSLSGVQQTFASAVPHTCGAPQFPQVVTVRGAPQLSVELRAPQFFPSRAQKALSDSGVQAQVFCGVQYVPAPQSPQLTLRGCVQLS